MLSSLAFRSAAVAMAAGVMSAAPVVAHDYWTPQAGRAIQVYTQGGAYSPLADLDDGGRVDFRTGFAIGGGAAYQFNEHVAVRAGINFARAEARVTGPLTLAIDSIDGKKFNRYLFDADVQLRYPFDSGLTPYVFAGAGGVTVERDVARMRSRFTRLAGKTGVGIGYLIPDRSIGLHVEAAGWLYQWDRYGFDRTQFDATVNAGISYRFALR